MLGSTFRTLENRIFKNKTSQGLHLDFFSNLYENLDVIIQQKKNDQSKKIIGYRLDSLKDKMNPPGTKWWKKDSVLSFLDAREIPHETKLESPCYVMQDLDNSRKT